MFAVINQPAAVVWVSANQHRPTAVHYGISSPSPFVFACLHCQEINVYHKRRASSHFKEAVMALVASHPYSVEDGALRHYDFVAMNILLSPLHPFFLVLKVSGL